MQVESPALKNTLKTTETFAGALFIFFEDYILYCVSSMDRFKLAQYIDGTVETKFDIVFGWRSRFRSRGGLAVADYYHYYNWYYYCYGFYIQSGAF